MGLGTGKTLFGILRGLILSQEFPDNLGLIVRKEYVDLKNSLIKDFEQYTGLDVGSNKEVKLKNGSTIMFCHADELDVLKNINLGWFMMEQAEEFQVDEQFEFLRGRLRRSNVPFHTGFIVGNTAGHNWIWKLWKTNLPSLEYELIEATTFENEENLPRDYILDLKRLEIESPHHFKRYVLNSWEDFEEFDNVFSFEILKRCIKQGFMAQGNYLISCDPAHYGDDETVITVLQRLDEKRFKQILLEGHKNKDLMWTAGRIIDLRKTLGPEKVSHIIIDDIGLGTGLSDRLQEQGISVYRYKGSEQAINDGFYNKRAECYWKLKEILELGLIDLLSNEKQIQQLLSIKYSYKSNGKKYIESKEDLKSRGLVSPDYADALMMAVSEIDYIPEVKGEMTEEEFFWGRVKKDIKDIRQTQGAEQEFKKMEEDYVSI